MGSAFREHEHRDLVERCAHALDTVQRMERGEPYDVLDIAAQTAALQRRYGHPGIAYALRTWCDLLIAATPGARTGQLVRVAFLTDAGGVDAEPADPAHQWASDLVTARLAGDQVRFYRLTEALPDTFGDRAEYVLRLVEMVAHALAAYLDTEPARPGRIRPGLYQPTTAAS